MYGPVVVDR